MPRVSVLTVIVVASLLAGGCGGSPSTVSTQASPTAKIVGTVTQTKTDCTWSPKGGPISAGTFAIQFVNEAGIWVGFDVFELPEGRTYAEAAASVQKERQLAETGQEGIGHRAFFTGAHPIDRFLLEIDQSGSHDGEFQATTYVIVCLRRYDQVNDTRAFALAGPFTVVAA